MTTPLSRRSAMAALAIAPMAIPADIIASTQAPTSILLSKIDAFKRQDAMWDAYLRDVYNPMVEAYEAALAEIKDVTLSYSEGRRTYIFSTAEAYQIRNARRWLKNNSGTQNDAYADTMRQLVEAADTNDIARARAYRDHRVEQIEKGDTAFAEENGQLFKAVLAHPAQSMEDMFAKLQFVHKLQRFDWPDVHEALAADVPRLNQSRK